MENEFVTIIGIYFKNCDFIYNTRGPWNPIYMPDHFMRNKGRKSLTFFVDNGPKPSTIGSLIIEMSLIIVMGDKSLNFNNSDGCNNSDG